MSKAHNPDQKRQEAEIRQSEAAQRTPQEQLKRLDQLFGVDKGASKERAKLYTRIETHKGAAKKLTVPTEELGATTVAAVAAVEPPQLQPLNTGKIRRSKG